MKQKIEMPDIIHGDNLKNWMQQVTNAINGEDCAENHYQPCYCKANKPDKQEDGGMLKKALDQQKAEIVEMVREQERKMKASKWLHGMGLSGSQAEFIEANVVASLDDIIKRLEGE